jgi:hypothetical protein
MSDRDMKLRMKVRMQRLVLPLMIAALAIGAAPGAAQVPTPPPSPVNTPVSPRPPRTPRPPRAWVGGDDGVARIDTVLPFSSNGTIDLSLVAGTMKVSTWDRNQVHVVASTTGAPSLQLDASSSHLTLEQTRSGGRHGRGDDVGTATYEVTVPAGSRASLSAVSGSINAGGLRGAVDVSNVSGSVDLRDLGSSLNAEGVSGNITVANVASDAHVENVSGRISLSGVGGSATAETVSGGINIAGVRGDRVHVTTVSGDIDFAGSVTGSGRYEFETHSGEANLKLASNTQATVSVETFSGSVSNEFPGAVRRRNSDPDDDSSNYEFIINRGGGRVRVETFSGSVHISKGNQ